MMRILAGVFFLFMKVTESSIYDINDEISSASLLHGPNFNYTCLGGPLDWHGLDMKHNALCAKGRYQSPINIDSNIHSGFASISMQILRIDIAHFENLGSTVEIAVSEGRLFSQAGHYALKKFHFHTPSEHRINEEYYPMEVHFVFNNSDNLTDMILAGRVAVVGFVFELTETGLGDPLFENVLSRVHRISSPGTSVRVGRLNFGHLAGHLESHPVYQYSGSLATPPCTENVAWYISSQPLALSVKSFNAIKHVLKFNSRYTQNTPGEINLLEVAASDLDPVAPNFLPIQHELR